MKNPLHLTVAVGLSLLACLTATPARADGQVDCGASTRSQWQAVNALKKRVWMEGWTLIKTETTGNCYEVYARNAQGQVVEAFFHPVTLEKRAVYRRGQQIYPAR